MAVEVKNKALPLHCGNDRFAFYIILFMLWILVLHSASIYLFTRGFLLTRVELGAKSLCKQDFKRMNISRRNHEFRMPSKNNSFDDAGNETKPDCWTTRGFEKVVIIIIDACRFDFVYNTTEYDATNGSPWLGRLTSVALLLHDRKNSSELFRFVADPPTTSLQRLKGLTTGGLPTFIDVGSSFTSAAISEDNFLIQLNAHGRRMHLLGDDTWLDLFPNSFAKSKPYPSLVVKDIHTVDNGVLSHIFQELNGDDWDVLIGHFLGVDHVGHTYCVDSPTMLEKLDQMNRMISDVASAVIAQSSPGDRHEKTLLLFMGDHAQSQSGDHGGGTPEETDTFLFAMSMSVPPGSLPLGLSKTQPCYSQTRRSFCVPKMDQIDFAPTLSALLGVPFPYASLGKVSPELFALSPTSWRPPIGSGPPHESHFLENYRSVLRINSWQVHNYLAHYSQSAPVGFKKKSLDSLWSLYLSTEVPRDHNGTHRYLRDIEPFVDYLQFAAEVARSQWTQFGLVSMFLGLLLMAGCSGVFLRELSLLSQGRFQAGSSLLVPVGRVAAGGLAGAALLPLSLTFLAPELSTERSFLVEMAVFGFAATSVAVYAFLGVRESSSKGRLSWSRLVKSVDSRTLGAAVVTAVHCGSLFSNSFIVAEGHVLHFLLATLAILQAARSFLEPSPALLPTLTLLASSPFLSPSPSTLPLLSPHLSLLSIFLLLSFPLPPRPTGFPHSILRTWTIALSRCIFIAISLLWLWEDWTKGDEPPAAVVGGVSPWLTLMVPRAVYLASFMILVGTLQGTLKGPAGVRAGLVGLAGALIGPIVMLAGRQGAEVALLACLQAGALACLLGRSPVANEEVPGVREGGGEVHWSSGVEWSFMAAHFYFCTGHKCNFDGLHYNAAFVGFDDFQYSRQGALLALETFGLSHVLPCLALPLVATVQLPEGSPDAQRKTFQNSVAKLVLGFSLHRTLAVLATLTFVFIERRHLMVWSIFAPKYLFDAVSLLLADSCLLLSLLLAFYFFGRVEINTKEPIKNE